MSVKKGRFSRYDDQPEIKNGTLFVCFDAAYVRREPNETPGLSTIYTSCAAHAATEAHAESAAVTRAQYA